MVLKLTPDVVPGLRTAWIGGTSFQIRKSVVLASNEWVCVALVLALGSAFIYEAVLLTVIDPPLPDTES